MAVIGVFCSLDFFLFYIFYELMLLPLYFLIGMWGGVRREYAAIKFFLYTLFGSVFMLLVMIGLYLSVTDPATGNHTFNMVQMMNPANYGQGSIFAAASNYTLFGIHARTLGFIILFIAFAIKVPLYHYIPGCLTHTLKRQRRYLLFLQLSFKNRRVRYYPDLPGYIP
jgi:NADH-quinone oxidoreductase subunit M